MTRTPAFVAVLVVMGCGGEGNGEDVARGRALTLDLAAKNDSVQSGTARLMADGEKTRVVVELANPPDVARPSHIHTGTSDEIGDVVAPLENVDDGRVESVVDMSLAELRRGGFIVHAHKPEAEYDISGRVRGSSGHRCISLAGREAELGEARAPSGGRRFVRRRQFGQRALGSVQISSPRRKLIASERRRIQR